MPTLAHKTQPSTDRLAAAAQSVSLTQAAIDLLHAASGATPEDPDVTVEERSIWQPDFWLMQRSWQALADLGAGDEALTVAAFLELRHPLAPAQALYRVAQQAHRFPALKQLVAQELDQLSEKLFNPLIVSDEERQTERLLLAGASAALIQDDARALACLERLDQMPRVWGRVLAQSDLRDLLAQTVARVGLSPLTSYLVATAIRRFEESGAQFLHETVAALAAATDGQDLTRRARARWARLMQRCIETFQFATLATLNSRRLAAIAFGRGGMVADVLSQLVTMANVQEARRESGLSSLSGDPNFLRQVTRPNANPDVDYQVYTLQEATRAMPVRRISREDRIELADRIAALSVQSDGWTAVGAASTLVSLGALKYAVEAVDSISPNDPTRSEGVISLVRALLDFGEEDLAREQVDKALNWVKSYEKRNPERATIWGLAEVYLDHNQPDMALYLLQQRVVQPSFGERLRSLVRTVVTDDQLRDDRLRFRALLAKDPVWTKEIQQLYDQLRQWTPRLLEGESLISFYVDGLMQPLLNAGLVEQALALLPQVVSEALINSAGEKHSVHVRRVASLLASLPGIGAADAATPPAGNGNGAGSSQSIPIPTPDAVHRLREFLLLLWQADAAKSVWQIVHGVEGSLPLVAALEGPQAVVAIAQAAADDGGLWSA